MENQNGQASETALAVVEQSQPTTSVDVFRNTKSFEHAQRVAKMLSESDLIPVTFQKKIGNCVIALEMSSRTGASPLMVMQNLYIVHGKPAWSSQFLIATLNACGRFSSIRYEEDVEDGGRTRAYATELKSKEKCYGAWVSMKMAEAEGWVNKNGSKWKTMPELMRRYRAATFFTRQFAPEVSMGIQTVEEAHDVTFEELPVTTEALNEAVPEVAKETTKRDRIEKLIRNAKSMDDLNKHRKSAGEHDLLDLFLERENELTPNQE